MSEERERMVRTLKALANPIRLRMIASLSESPKHLYALAKELGLSYPLAHLHLKALRRLGLVREIREERKAEGLPSVKYYAPAPFKLILSPESIRELWEEREDG